MLITGRQRRLLNDTSPEVAIGNTLLGWMGSYKWSSWPDKSSTKMIYVEIRKEVLISFCNKYLGAVHASVTSILGKSCIYFACYVFVLGSSFLVRLSLDERFSRLRPFYFHMLNYNKEGEKNHKRHTSLKSCPVA